MSLEKEHRGSRSPTCEQNPHTVCPQSPGPPYLCEQSREPGFEQGVEILSWDLQRAQSQLGLEMLLTLATLLLPSSRHPQLPCRHRTPSPCPSLCPQPAHSEATRPTPQDRKVNIPKHVRLSLPPSTLWKRAFLPSLPLPTSPLLLLSPPLPSLCFGAGFSVFRFHWLQPHLIPSWSVLNRDGNQLVALIYKHVLPQPVSSVFLATFISSPQRPPPSPQGSLPPTPAAQLQAGRAPDRCGRPRAPLVDTKASPTLAQPCVSALEMYRVGPALETLPRPHSLEHLPQARPYHVRSPRASELVAGDFWCPCWIFN